MPVDHPRPAVQADAQDHLLDVVQNRQIVHRHRPPPGDTERGRAVRRPDAEHPSTDEPANTPGPHRAVQRGPYAEAASFQTVRRYRMQRSAAKATIAGMGAGTCGSR